MAFYDYLRPAPFNDPTYDLIVHTPPSVEPITYADLVAHLKLDQDYDEDLVVSFGVAARQYVEAMTSLTFINTTYDVSYDAFDNYGMRFPRRPFQSVVSVSYYDQNDNLQTLDPTLYRVSKKAIWSKLLPKWGLPFPVNSFNPNAITVRFVAGMGSSGAAVPQLAKTLIAQWGAYLYENREAVIIGKTPVIMPLHFQSALKTLSTPEVF